MDILINAIVILVGLLHIYFMILEMFLWTKPKGLKVFGQSLQSAQATATLAANQGLYNGFLAAGLFWSFFINDPSQAQQVRVFFLACVAIAGLYGGWTVSKKIMMVQAVPAILGLILILIF